MTKKKCIGWLNYLVGWQCTSEISSPQPESAPATIPSTGLAPNAPMASRVRVPDCENGLRVQDCVFNFFFMIYKSHTRFITTYHDRVL